MAKTRAYVRRPTVGSLGHTLSKKTGPRKLFHHVGKTPVPIKLTPSGVALLDQHCDRTGLRRGDLTEYLVRKYAHLVPEGLMDVDATT